MRGLMVEELAESLLRGLGFEIKEKRKRVTRNDTFIAEIDILAEKEGVVYAVEVKTGKASTSDVRQAYANAVLVKAKPLIVCRGFSDKGAEETAKQLGVEVISFPSHYFFASPEDLSKIIERAVEKVLLRLLRGDVRAIDPEDVAILNAIARSSTFKQAAKSLDMDEKELENEIVKLKKRNILTNVSSYDSMRLQSLLLIREYEVLNSLESIRRKLEALLTSRMM